MPDVPPISYVLPRHQTLESHEDWSRVSDRKMKKRLQNRIAQRAYRRRTREHIEGLEAELNAYRRRTGESQEGSVQGESRDDDDTIVSSPARAESSPPPSSSSSQAQQQQQQQQQGEPPQQQLQQQQQIPVSTGNDYLQAQGQSQTQSQDQSQGGNGRQKRQRQRPLLSQQRPVAAPLQPPQSQLQPHLQHNAPEFISLAEANHVGGSYAAAAAARGGMRPGHHTMHSSGSTASMSSVSPSVAFGSMNQHVAASSNLLSNQLPVSLSAEELQQAAWTRPAQDGGIYQGQGNATSTFMSHDLDKDVSDDGHVLGVADDADGNEDDDAEHDHDYADAGIGGVGHNINQPSNGLAPSLTIQQPTQTTQPQTHTQIQTRTPTHPPPPISFPAVEATQPPDTWDVPNSISPPIDPSTASLEQRINLVFEWIQRSGFSSLDHLLEVWYTAPFSDDSPLRQEQRLSRHRGLTKLLTRLRESSPSWTKWERFGYQEEMLLGAETLLREEYAALAGSAQFARHVVAVGTSGGGDGDETRKALRRYLQDELPQLRTLLAAATADTSRAGRQANRKAIDAATMVLAMAGRVPDEKLLTALQCELQTGANRLGEGAGQRGR